MGSVRRTSQVEPTKSSISLLLGKTGSRFIDLEAETKEVKNNHHGA